MMEFDFSSKSSKEKILLGHENKLFTKTNFTLNANGRIMKSYWSCINKSCPGKISYTVDAQMDHPRNGMNDGTLHCKFVEHENELCHTDEIEVIHRAARRNILSQASQGK